ncbi:MAG: 3-phosphoshikimate 1-carboxyvinyltransferase [Candidatus Zixiibacteriota bacterium]
MTTALSPIRRVGGSVRVPGDKSIAHRAALLSILSKGEIRVSNYPDGQDCLASLKAAQTLGVAVKQDDNSILLTPPGHQVIDPDCVVDCQNSGTTARLLAGIAAGSNMELTLVGDESLSNRPMKRIIDPLTEMGAQLFADDAHLPIRVRGTKLLPFEYTLPVASAQVKSAILLAGLASSCSVSLREETVTRDHTERMIAAIGSGLSVREIKPQFVTDPNDPRKKKLEMPESFKVEITVSPQAAIEGGEIDIPGDMSTAAFFFATAAISGKPVTVEQVGLNPTRTAFLEYLKLIGCKVEISGRHTVSDEPRGDVTVSGRGDRSRKIAGEKTVGLIDEIPIISIIAAFANGTTVIRDASELKVKESNRLEAIADNLERMGVKCGRLDDGLAIEGNPEPAGADFISYGDHRIAMACTIASLFAAGPSTLDDDSCIAVSCPGFFNLLRRIAQ